MYKNKKKKEIGMMIIFRCKKEFFDDYIVDYGYGDTNRNGAIF